MEVTFKQAWQISQESWDSFLALLDTDRDRAGEKYEALRSKLLIFFRCRACIPPEDCADETLNRVMRRSGEEQILNINSHTLGVARFVAAEAPRSDR